MSIGTDKENFDTNGTTHSLHGAHNLIIWINNTRKASDYVSDVLGEVH